MDIYLIILFFSIFTEGLLRGRTTQSTNVLLGMTYSDYQKRNGMDHRNVSGSTEQHMAELHRIYRIFRIEKTLEILRNPAIPEHIKLGLIEKHGLSPANISAGGLMDEFYNDFEG